ncbi:MAG: ATP-binding protein [Deltaproteobacteria bacterium]|nr:ATP-binding protein [Deltaproteobacteria bacterium]
MGLTFNMGARRTLKGAARGGFELPADDLVTHGVVVGMTGSGKTGLITVLVEEAIRNGIPVLLLDVKGDLANLKLAFPSYDAKHLASWVEAARGDEDGVADVALVDEVAAERRMQLMQWGISEDDLARYCESTHVRVITPGSDAGEPLHLLSALERRSARWDHDVVNARATLEAAVSMVLRLMGRDPDPAQSRAHALLTAIAERRLVANMPADLASLLPDIITPPFETIGALDVETYIGLKARGELAADLNTLIASSSLARWRQGQDLDVGKWMEPVDGKTPATIISVAHLQDDERALALGVVLEEALAWTRSRPGTNKLRGMIVFDEIYGYLPPHPYDPPTKKPLVALMKQARAFGVGCIVATQNPMDLDYRALSNAGTWILGRLQTPADLKRVIEGLGETMKGPIAKKLMRIAKRWFLVRMAGTNELTMLHPRWAISLLRGPMTALELRRAGGETTPRGAATPT